MKRSVLLVLVLIVLSTVSWAQFRNNVNQGPSQRRSNNSSDPLQRVYFGGGGSLGFGTGYSYYSIFPVVGYRLTSDFSVGTGFTYQRTNFSASYYPVAYHYTQYGFTPFVRYNLNPLFIQTELDLISTPVIDNNGETVRAFRNRFLVGLGYSTQGSSSGLRRRGAFNILAMYDLLYTQSEQGIYGSPIVLRVFVTF